jgi:DNA-binding NarL/FixJ family response regulator
MTAIQAVMQDTAWFSRSVIERLAAIKSGRPASDPSELDDLTPRERDVLNLLAQGKSNAEIAAALGIAEQTVRNYVASIYSKLNVILPRSHGVIVKPL